MKHPLITVASFQMDYESSQWLSQLGTIQKQMHAGLREGIDFEFNKDDGSVKMVEKKDPDNYMLSGASKFSRGLEFRGQSGGQ